MAHIAKYTKAAMGHMLNHYGRSEDLERSAYIVRGNDNIDPSRTALNYNLASKEQPLRQLDFIHKRLSEVKVQNRKDVNILCDWVLTAPKDLPEGEHAQFFADSYQFLANKYGRENVISAFVHRDETSDHMHFAFIPIVPDHKRGGLKVSAKEAITRKDLQTFHGELEAHLERTMGHKVSILNDATRDGNKSIAELKRGTAIAELKQVEKDISKGLQVIKRLREEADRLNQQMKKDTLASKEVKEIPHRKSFFGNKQVVSSEDFEALCKAASIAESLLDEVKSARQVLVQRDKILSKAESEAKETVSKANKKAEQIIQKSRSSSVQNSIDKAKIQSELDKINRVFDANPDLYSAFNKAKYAMRQAKRDKNRGPQKN